MSIVWIPVFLKGSDLAYDQDQTFSCIGISSHSRSDIDDDRARAMNR